MYSVLACTRLCHPESYFVSVFQTCIVDEYPKPLWVLNLTGHRNQQSCRFGV